MVCVGGGRGWARGGAGVGGGDVGWACVWGRGKRKDFAKFENIHIEKTNVYISGEEKRTFVKF